jgi:hypothetical protein
MYPDADKHVVEIQEAIADAVVKAVMDLHYEKPVPQPTRVTRHGLVFVVHHPVDIRGESLAGKKIARELRSLGFIGIEFYDAPIAELGTAIEYTLPTVAYYEEYWALVDKDEEEVTKRD